MKGIDLDLSPQAIAVTGCIGSGKSKVAQWLGHEWALPVYDADDEVKILLSPGHSGWMCLKAILGETYFDIESRLNKSKLRQAIFADASLRQSVEDALHPLVLENLKVKTAQFTMPCLVEVPLLYEVNWQSYFSKVLVVYADPNTCIHRVMARDGVNKAQALAALRNQRSIQEKISFADCVINNSGAWTDTLSQLEAVKKAECLPFGKKKLDTLCY
ncbi:MAG: dephospho-CoA kinase [Proteobacteria bacterium]|nr:dephospho-CoA kinase [Desulfobulbaceae bacterium]MBU3915955.1 dephospho-CoA kinase [bacterium]MBU4154475.1 dephospho-CoA kinase [Pseudomonadota bacterium]